MEANSGVGARSTPAAPTVAFVDNPLLRAHRLLGAGVPGVPLGVPAGCVPQSSLASPISLVSQTAQAHVQAMPVPTLQVDRVQAGGDRVIGAPGPGACLTHRPCGSTDNVAVGPPLVPDTPRSCDVHWHNETPCVSAGGSGGQLRLSSAALVVRRMGGSLTPGAGLPDASARLVADGMYGPHRGGVGASGAGSGREARAARTASLLSRAGLASLPVPAVGTTPRARAFFGGKVAGSTA